MTAANKMDNDHNCDENSTLPEEAVKTICILQITRIGDVVQTLQAAQSFKKNHPKVRLVLVAREQFAGPLNFLLTQTFDKCFFLNGKKLLSPKIHKDLDSAHQGLKDFIQNINSENISVTVNLSFSKSSTYLCSLIDSPHKLGPRYDSMGALVIKDKWSQFVYSNVMRGSLCPFSLVDIYKRILGITKEDAPEPEVSIGEIKKVVIHPFASYDKKRWKREKWSEVIYKILKDNPDIEISLAGNKADSSDADAIMNSTMLKQFDKRLTNLAGKTSIEQLYLHLESSSLFLGHDSMVGHLASVAGTPTITISLGTVRPHETTPYGAGNYNLSPKTSCYPCFPDTKCDFFQCHSDIPYQVVNTSIQQIINEGQITQEYLEENVTGFLLNSVNIYKSEYSSLNFTYLKNISNINPSFQEVYRVFYRIAWLFMFENDEEKHPFPKLSTATHKELIESVKGLQHLFELTEFGKKYSRFILEEIASDTPELSVIREYSNKIDEIDQLQTLVIKGHPCLEPIVDFFTVLKGNLEGTSVVDLTESSYLCYNDCSSIISILYELLELTVAQYKLISNKTKLPAETTT